MKKWGFIYILELRTDHLVTHPNKVPHVQQFSILSPTLLSYNACSPPHTQASHHHLDVSAVTHRGKVANGAFATFPLANSPPPNDDDDTWHVSFLLFFFLTLLIIIYRLHIQNRSRNHNNTRFQCRYMGWVNMQNGSGNHNDRWRGAARGWVFFFLF
jgi:hypothetical protein